VRPGAATDVPALAADLRLVLGRTVRRLRRTPADGVTPSQLSALSNLDEHGPLRVRDLAAQEGVSAPTVSRVVDLLVERDLVQRSVDPGDARGTVVSLTDGGNALLRRTRTARDAVLADAIGRLDPDDVDRLRAALPALRALLGELSGPPGVRE
jgi:DNA-binding MarR family transcriptional regulator